MAREPMTGMPAAGATPSLIRWGAVFAGVVLGLAILILLGWLWMALAFGTEVQGVQDNLGWFLGASAIVALFVGGLLAGWLSGVPGFAPGLFNGLSVWGLTLIGSIAIGLPGFVQLTAADPELLVTPGTVPPEQALWAGFVSLLIGAVTAALGGALGGALTQPAFVYAVPDRAVERRERVRTEPADEDRRTPAHAYDEVHTDPVAQTRTEPAPAEHERHSRPVGEDREVVLPEDERAGRPPER